MNQCFLYKLLKHLVFFSRSKAEWREMGITAHAHPSSFALYSLEDLVSGANMADAANVADAASGKGEPSGKKQYADTAAI